MPQTCQPGSRKHSFATLSLWVSVSFPTWQLETKRWQHSGLMFPQAFPPGIWKACSCELSQPWPPQEKSTLTRWRHPPATCMCCLTSPTNSTCHGLDKNTFLQYCGPWFSKDHQPGNFQTCPGKTMAASCPQVAQRGASEVDSLATSWPVLFFSGSSPPSSSPPLRSAIFVPAAACK